MTPNAFVYRTLSGVCPGAYVAYPVGDTPGLPFFVYKRVNGGEVYADDGNYALIPRYRVELLIKENDPLLVERFEDALSELGTWRLYDADWLDSEGCIDHDYRLSINLAKLRETEARDG